MTYGEIINFFHALNYLASYTKAQNIDIIK